MIGFPLGLAYVNAGEWLIHKYLLHGRGVQKTSVFAFHWHQHHGACRRNGDRDELFETPWWRNKERRKEIAGLALAAATHAPLFPIAPFFTSAVLYGIGNYYRVHKKSHLDVEWGRKHVPWHYDHHMGPTQHANWCVTRPWFDWVMGTRKPYVGTEREREDIEKRRRLQERRARPAVASDSVKPAFARPQDSERESACSVSL